MKSRTTLAEIALAAIEKAIAEARFVEARSTVRALQDRRLDRSQRLRLASLATQAGLPQAALTLLYTTVRANAKRAQGHATPSEKITYAYALSQMGPSREATELLSQVDFKAHPVAASHYGFAYFRLWDWVTPRSALERALENQNSLPVEKAAVMANLATTLMYGELQLARSQKLLESASELTAAEPSSLMHINIAQLLGQNYIYQQKWQEAGRTMAYATRLAPPERDSYLNLVVRQWTEILALHVSKNRGPHLRALGQIEAGFKAIGRYENARRCAFFKAIAVKDEKLLVHLYFGSPYAGAKAKILETLGWEQKRLPAFYDYLPSGKLAAKTPVFNVFNGEFEGSRLRLKPGQIVQRLLETLATDFYEPPSSFRIHEVIYPDCAFDPEISYGKVAQAISRLRHWLVEARIPLAVHENLGRFRLQPLSPLLLRIPRNDYRLAPTAKLDSKLRDFILRTQPRFGDRWFKSSEVQLLMGISDCSARALIQCAEAANLAIRKGRGAGTRYRLIKDSTE